MLFDNLVKKLGTFVFYLSTAPSFFIIDYVCVLFSGKSIMFLGYFNIIFLRIEILNIFIFNL